jgi:hypothetical protein
LRAPEPRRGFPPLLPLRSLRRLPPTPRHPSSRSPYRSWPQPPHPENAQQWVSRSGRGCVVQTALHGTSLDQKGNDSVVSSVAHLGGSCCFLLGGLRWLHVLSPSIGCGLRCGLRRGFCHGRLVDHQWLGPHHLCVDEQRSIAIGARACSADMRPGQSQPNSISWGVRAKPKSSRLSEEGLFTANVHRTRVASQESQATLNCPGGETHLPPAE